MLSPEKIERINQLATKKKAEGLTPAEVKEQAELREAYLTAFRSGMRHHIEGMKVVDPDGNDITPDKLKEIQKKKGIHDRNSKF